MTTEAKTRDLPIHNTIRFGLPDMLTRINGSGEPSVLDVLIKAGETVKLLPGEKLFSQGEHATKIHLIVSGNITLRKEPKKQTLEQINSLKETLKPGDVIWDGLSTLEKHTDEIQASETASEPVYSSTAMAREDCEIISIPVDDFSNLMQKDPRMPPYFLPLITKAVIQKEQFIHSQKTGDTGQRMAAFIDSSHENGELFMSQEEIGEHIGTTRESVNRAIAKLVGTNEEDRIIETGTLSPISIVVRQEEKLQEKANPPIQIFPESWEATHPTNSKEAQFDPDLTPNDMTKAGTLLRSIRIRYRIPEFIIARAIKDGRKKDVIAFENGEVTEFPLEMYINALKNELKKHNVPDGNGSVIELERLAEQQKWLQALTKKDMTLGKALRLIRLGQRKVLTNVSTRTLIPFRTINDYERDDAFPDIKRLNSLIKEYNFDENSTVAQLLRLLNASMKPLSLIDLQTMDPDEIKEYPEVITGGNVNEKSSLVKIIRLRENGQQIPVSILQQTVKERYLITEHIEPYTISNSIQIQIEKLQEKNSVGEILVQMIKAKFPTLKDFAKSSGIPYGSIRDWGSRSLGDDNLCLALGHLGYEFHHPITQFLLEKAELERRKKRKSKALPDVA